MKGWYDKVHWLYFQIIDVNMSCSYFFVSLFLFLSLTSFVGCKSHEKCLNVKPCDFTIIKLESQLLHKMVSKKIKN
jgi:hypothetical protein